MPAVYGPVFCFCRIHSFLPETAQVAAGTMALLNGHHPTAVQANARAPGQSAARGTPVFDRTAPASAKAHQVILGLDPSLRGTGYGVIKLAKPYPQTLTQGVIACPMGWEHSRCLAKIAVSLREVLRQHQPTVCVIEGLFYAQNLQTALIMGEARGAALASHR
jgi:hypothetical protein